MPVVMITPEPMRSPDAPYARLLREADFEVRYPQSQAFARGTADDDTTVRELADASACIAGAEYFNAEVIAALPELRVIARAGVGYDRVDIEAATRRGIAVTITPTANHEAVAEHALALLLAAAKELIANRTLLLEGSWPRSPTLPVRGRTLGIVGLGRIGRSLAVRGRALGMRVIATEERPDATFVAAHDIELVDLDTLLARSDYVSLHCPLTRSTSGLINATALEKVRPGSIIVNTARGGLIVEKDLLAALDSGRVAAAALDVFEKEPPDPASPLLRHRNVVVSPHLAGCDERSIEDMGLEAARSIVQLHRGEWPEGAVVNEELRGTWKW